MGWGGAGVRWAVLRSPRLRACSRTVRGISSGNPTAEPIKSPTSFLEPEAGQPRHVKRPNLRPPVVGPDLLFCSLVRGTLPPKKLVKGHYWGSSETKWLLQRFSTVRLQMFASALRNAPAAPRGQLSPPAARGPAEPRIGRSEASEACRHRLGPPVERSTDLGVLLVKSRQLVTLHSSRHSATSDQVNERRRPKLFLGHPSISTLSKGSGSFQKTIRTPGKRPAFESQVQIPDT